MEYYFNEIVNIEKVIDRLKMEIYQIWFKTTQDETLSPNFSLGASQRDDLVLLRNIAELVEVFGIDLLDKNRRNLETSLNIIESPPSSIKWEKFRVFFDAIREIFKIAQPALMEKFSLLDKEEANRINEAFNCFIQELNYSSIVMSVSAIESRLLSLMLSKRPNAKLERLTLGDLIREYLENKISYDNIVPDKHLPLLQYCNSYRIVSVHPKKEKINRANATTILCMTCSFLFDKDMKIEN